MVGSNNSVRNRVQMFEDTTTGINAKSSLRHRMSPRGRAHMQRMSPRSRFSRMKAVKVEDDDSGIPKMYVSVASSEDPPAPPPKDENESIIPSTTSQQQQAGETKQLKSIPSNGGTLASNNINIPPGRPKDLRLTTKMDTIESMDTTEGAPTPQKSPSSRQPKSPKVLASMSPRSPTKKSSSKIPKSPNNAKMKPDHIQVKYQELNDEDGTEEHEGSGGSTGGKQVASPLLKQARMSFRKSPRFKPEWQLNRRKILGNKAYVSPLSIKKLKKNHQDLHEEPREEGQASAVENMPPREEASVFWPEEDDNSDCHQGNLDSQNLPIKVEERHPPGSDMQLLTKSPAGGGGSLLAPPAHDSPRGRSARQSKWRSVRERSRTRSPSASPQHTMVAAPALNHTPRARPNKLPLTATDSHTRVPVTTVITSPRKPTPRSLPNEEVAEKDSEDEELEAIIKDLCPSSETFSTISSKDAFQDKNREGSEQHSHIEEQAVSTTEDRKVSKSVAEANGAPPVEKVEHIRKRQSPSQRKPASSMGNLQQPPTEADHDEKSLESGSLASGSVTHSAQPSPKISRVSRLRTMKANSPAVLAAVKNRRAIDGLKQNLDAASAVLQDEKVSSVGSNGSDRSCLSNEELGNIASRALAMSRVLDTSRHGKLRKSTPLHNLLKQRGAQKLAGTETSSLDNSEVSKQEVLAVPETKHKSQASVPKTTKSQSPDEQETHSFQHAKWATKGTDATTQPDETANDEIDPSSPFPRVNRSYRNTRLARKYLHKQAQSDGNSVNSDDPASNPKHALRDDSSAGTASTSSERKQLDLKPFPSPSANLPTWAMSDSLQNRSPQVVTKNSIPPASDSQELSHSIDPLPNAQSASNSVSAYSPRRLSRTSSHTSKHNTSSSVPDYLKDAVPALAASDGPSVSTPVKPTRTYAPKVSLISAVTNKKERLALLSAARSPKPASPLADCKSEAKAPEAAGKEKPSPQKKCQTYIKGKASHHLRVARASGLIAKHRQVVAGVSVVTGVKSKQDIHAVTAVSTSAENPKEAIHAPDMNFSDPDKREAKTSPADKARNSDATVESYDFAKVTEHMETSAQKANSGPIEMSKASSESKGIQLTSEAISTSSTDDSLFSEPCGSAKVGEQGTTGSAELPNDIISRTARRRQHPAFAARKQTRVKTSRVMAAAKGKAMSPGVSNTALGLNEDTKTKLTQVECKTQTAINGTSNDPPDTASMKSIFGENKGIAFAFWKYSQAKEASHALKGKDPEAEEDQGRMERNTSEEARDAPFVTMREENMHTFHELDTSIAELTSAEITFSMGSGSSEDPPSKPAVVGRKALDPPEVCDRRDDPSVGLPGSPNLENEIEEEHQLQEETDPLPSDSESENASGGSMLLGETLTTMTSGENDGNISKAASANSTPVAADKRQVDKDGNMAEAGSLDASFDDELTELAESLAQEEDDKQSGASPSRTDDQFNFRSTHESPSSSPQSLISMPSTGMRSKGSSLLEQREDEIKQHLEEDLEQVHTEVAPSGDAKLPTLDEKLFLRARQTAGLQHQDNSPATRSLHDRVSVGSPKQGSISTAKSFCGKYSYRESGKAQSANQRGQKTAVVPAAKSFSVNCNQVPEAEKTRTPAKHRRHFSSGGVGTEVQFKYQDLKSLSLQENSGGLEMKKSYDSDLPCDDDIFSGIDEGMGMAMAGDPPPPPPPPPPQVPADDRFGRVLDEKQTTTSVNSDITSSVLALERNPNDQRGKIICEDNALKTVNSDITSSLLAGERRLTQYYQCTHDEEGFTLIDELDELDVLDELDEMGAPESIDDESQFIREHLSGSKQEPIQSPSRRSRAASCSSGKQSRCESSPAFERSESRESRGMVLHQKSTISESRFNPPTLSRAGSCSSEKQSKCESSQAFERSESRESRDMVLHQKSTISESRVNPSKLSRAASRSSDKQSRYNSSQALERSESRESRGFVLHQKSTVSESRFDHQTTSSPVIESHDASVASQSSRTSAMILCKNNAHQTHQLKAAHGSPSEGGTGTKELVQHQGTTVTKAEKTDKPTSQGKQSLAQPRQAESRIKDLMDGSMIVKMGLAMMGSFSEGMMSIAKEMPSRDNLFGQSSNTDLGRSESAESVTKEVLTDPDADVDGEANGEANSPLLNEAVEDKLGSYEDDESEDSHYVPDIDDYSEDPDDLESAISLVLLEENKITPDVPSNATQESEISEISEGHIETLREFSSVYKQNGIEVLKLNRRNKWQTRFLTVSSEMLELEHVGDMSEFPRALLWVKRFSSNQSYSLGSSNDGRGGVEFAKIESTEIEDSENRPPKSNAKFKNSVQVNLHFDDGSRTLALRFKTKTDADYFVSSMDAIVDMLDHEGIY